eukprot:9538246-Ditylum_brightwellii.AAC.1
MKHVEDHKYIAGKQHSGRECTASINVVAISRLTTETQHYQCSNAAMTDCNAKSCFDRITPELLALLYAKAGCPPAVVELMYSALVQLEYSMITALSILAKKNSNTILHLLFGIGQGATNGPLGWTFYTNMLIQLYNKHTGGCAVQNPTGSIALK